MNHAKGTVFVLSAPSGTGKSTLAKRLVAALPDLVFSISITTRAPRPGEQDGREYFFVDDAAFDQKIAAGDFLEWVQVYAHRYGTSRSWIEAQLHKGKDVLLDIETIGALNIKQRMPDAVMIFLMPPSMEELSNRLSKRGDTSEEQMRLRLGHARSQLEQYLHYHYLVVNDSVDLAFDKLKAIIEAQRCRRDAMERSAESILQTFVPEPEGRFQE